MKKVLLITFVLCSTSVADDKAALKKTSAPLDVIADCVDAVKQRDFRRYVNHLSPDEQKLQAGVILLIQSSEMMSAALGGSNDTPPSHRLLLYVLTDLRKKHGVLESDDTAVNQASAALLGQDASGVIQQTGAVYPQLGAQIPTSVRDQCIQSAETLKDPSAFLVEALEEVFRPTEVTGKQPDDSVDTPGMSDMIEDVCKPYEKLEFTLYTRGDYAIATAEFPPPATVQDLLSSESAETPPVPVASHGQYAPAPAQFASPPPTGAQPAIAAAVPWPAPSLPYGPPHPAPLSTASGCESGVCVPARADSNAENRFTILFRRIDGQWKVTELFPLHRVL